MVVPSVAQAHHVDSKASCVLVGNEPTIKLTAQFVQFKSTQKVSGKIWIDGTQTFGGGVDVNWDGYNGTWTYERPATAGRSYTVKTEWYWKKGKDGETHKTNKCPKPPPPPKTPEISLEKTGADTAEAGSVFTYTFTATNTGDVTLTNVALTDDKCQSTLTRTDSTDQTFDPGDAWQYTCTVTAPAGPAQVDNRAEVCADYTPPQQPGQKVCDEDTHTFTVPPPTTPPSTPPSTPPATPPSTPPGTTPPPAGGTLPEEIVSGRAALRGPSGCVKQAFKARVRGRSISSVTFFVDGRQVKRISDERAVYRLSVSPERYGFGRHRIAARVRFSEASGTPARTLRLTFRRCAQGTVAPRFTG